MATQQMLFSVEHDKCLHFDAKKVFLSFSAVGTFTKVWTYIQQMKQKKKVHNKSSLLGVKLKR